MSGCGKTSLVRAGLLKRLREEDWQPIYISHYPSAARDADKGREPLDPAETTTVDSLLDEIDRRTDVKTALRVPVLLDQVEDLIHYPPHRELLRELLLRSRAKDRACALLFVLRTDSLVWLRRLLRQLDFGQVIEETELRRLGPNDGKDILGNLSSRYRFRFQADLKERLLKDLTDYADREEDEAAACLLLPQFSLVLRELYQRRKLDWREDVLLASDYAEMEVDKLLSNQMQQLLATFDLEAATVAKRLLIHMVDAIRLRPRVVTLEEVNGIADRHDLLRVIDALIARHLVRRLEHERLELVHEVLVHTICDKLLPGDLISREALGNALRLHLDAWRRKAAPLPIELLRRITPSIAQFELSEAETSLYAGSVLLHEQGGSEEFDAFLTSLSAEQLSEVTKDLRSSVDTKVQAMGLALALRNPPHLRGLSPITFATPSEYSAEARHLGEVLLPMLAFRALGIPPEGRRSGSEEEQDKEFTLELLSRSKLANQPILSSDTTAHLGLLRTLGNGWTMEDNERHPLAYWPGTWLSPTAV